MGEWLPVAPGHNWVTGRVIRQPLADTYRVHVQKRHPDSGARVSAEHEEEERFAALHRELYPRVRAYSMRRTMNEATADEIAAETLEIVWRRRDEPVRDQLSWTLGIARGVLANRRRSERRRAALEDRVAAEWIAAAPDPAEGVADRSELLAALATLDEDDRELLLLIAWDGLDRSQAAGAVGCSRATLAVRLHRARRRLEAAMEVDSPKEDVHPTGEVAR